MAFDLDVAKQLVSQIRERSVGPRVMEDVSALLHAAVEEVTSLRGIRHNLEMALTTVQEQSQSRREVTQRLDTLTRRVETLFQSASRSGALESALWAIVDLRWWALPAARRIAVSALDH